MSGVKEEWWFPLREKNDCLLKAFFVIWCLRTIANLFSLRLLKMFALVEWCCGVNVGVVCHLVYCLLLILIVSFGKKNNFFDSFLLAKLSSNFQESFKYWNFNQVFVVGLCPFSTNKFGNHTEKISMAPAQGWHV